MKKTREEGEAKTTRGPAPKRLAAFCSAHPQYKQAWVADQVKAGVSAAIEKAELEALHKIDPAWRPETETATESAAS